MFNRKEWREPAAKSTRCLQSKITITIDLAPDKPGGERTAFERMLRTIFPSGWTRKDARWVAAQAINAVSEGILADGCASFPLEAEMLHGKTRRGVKLADIIDVSFRVDDHAA